MTVRLGASDRLLSCCCGCSPPRLPQEHEHLGLPAPPARNQRLSAGRESPWRPPDDLLIVYQVRSGSMRNLYRYTMCKRTEEPLCQYGAGEGGTTCIVAPTPICAGWRYSHTCGGGPEKISCVFRHRLCAPPRIVGVVWRNGFSRESRQRDVSFRMLGTLHLPGRRPCREFTTPLCDVLLSDGDLLRPAACAECRWRWWWLGSSPPPLNPTTQQGSYLVDPASSHMLVSKIKPCMSKYKLCYTVKLRMAH